MGTKAIRAGGMQFTLHRIPVLPFHIGYCPKAAPAKIDWEALVKAGRGHKCAAIRFDCPNVVKRFHKYKKDWELIAEAEKEETLLKERCRTSPRNTFAQQTILLDLTHTKENLLMNMKSKTRYNVRYARRKGIRVENESTPQGLEKFITLQKETAARQDFLIHNKKYYQTLWETLAPKEKAHILIAYYKSDPTPLSAYMFFNHEGVFYYPYGGSSEKHRSRQHSSRVMWEGILLGKRLGCTLFDMWGATDDRSDDWWGFTRFKLGFGGTLVEFIDSYDLVLNAPVYHTFNLAYGSFWKLVNLKQNF